ncbi:MAG: TRAP transporter small permease [Gammaproteobacteria bacterium]|nr:TRAP transporter small permease [Gammaproteobacteria bacterium]
MAQALLATFARLDKAGRFIENLLLVSLLSAMMLIAVGQIVLREFFDSGFFWADELIRLIVLWLAMVGSIAACRENRHIRIDALSHLLPPKAITATRILVDLFAAGICALIAWHAYRYLQIEIEFEETVMIDTPAWMAHAIVPLAFLLLSYRFVVGTAKGLVDLLTNASDTAQ